MLRELEIRSRYLFAGASIFGLLAVNAPQAQAQTQDLQQIQAQIQEMQDTIKALQKQVQDAKAQATAANVAAANAGGSDLDLNVKWRGAPELSSEDGKFKMKVRGRLHVDYDAIDQDFDITGRPDVSAGEIRRARLGIEGVLWYDVKYIIEADFANDAVVLRDAYGEYTGLLNDLALRIGNQKTFNSLDWLNSSNYYTFQERPAFVEAWASNVRSVRLPFTRQTTLRRPQASWPLHQQRRAVARGCEDWFGAGHARPHQSRR